MSTMARTSRELVGGALQAPRQGLRQSHHATHCGQFQPTTDQPRRLRQLDPPVLHYHTHAHFVLLQEEILQARHKNRRRRRSTCGTRYWCRIDKRFVAVNRVAGTHKRVEISFINCMESCSSRSRSTNVREQCFAFDHVTATTTCNLQGCNLQLVNSSTLTTLPC